MLGPSFRDTLLPRALARATARAWPDVVWRGPPRTEGGAPALYLTVDDGPDPDGTPRWLDALAALGARALFFLSGPAVAARPDLARRIAAAGHGVGSHGGPHTSAWGADALRRPARWLARFADATDALEDAIGQPVVAVRPPYGRVGPGLVRWTRVTGRRLVLWDTMPGDYLPGATPERVAAALVRHARPGAVVVLHDGARAPVATDALALALPRLAAAGWRAPLLPLAS